MMSILLPPTLNRMVTERVLDLTLSTRSSKHYRISSPKTVKEILDELDKPIVEIEEEIPSDLFSTIVGYDNIKFMVKLSIESEKSTHLLLYGPPASAKTLFLMELHRLPESYYALGSTLTSAGLIDLLFTYEPKFLLIDEIDRLSGENLGALNSLMATGVISETKFKKTRRKVLNTRVYGAGIRIEKLPNDLLSRFIKLKFNPYTKQEFLKVARKVFQSEKLDNPDLVAEGIWELYGENSDIRQVVSVERLSGGDKDKIGKVLKTIRQFGGMGK